MNIEEFRADPPSQRIPVVIVLDEMQREISVDVGTKRHVHSRQNNVYDRNVSGKSGLDIDIEGVACEIAWCQYHGIKPDLFWEFPPSHYDCIWNGQKVDVKGTTYHNGRLLVPLKQADHDVDIYGFVTGVMPRYHVVGHISKSAVIRPENIHNPGRASCYLVDRTHREMIRYWRNK